jgi:hypothetical protein
MKVVYSLLASLVVGAIVIPMSIAQNPYAPAERYPSLQPQSVAQAPAPRSATNAPTTVMPNTTRSVAPTHAPAAGPSVNTTRIVTEQRPQNPPPIGAEPVPVQDPISGFPIAIAPSQHVPLSLGALQPTTEMWFYEQMRQDYNNPTLQVRRNSERAAQERKARLASMEWYGMSNSRPMAYTTPHMYHYSPTWTGGGRQPWSWSGSASSITIDARRVPTLGVSGIGTW